MESSMVSLCSKKEKLITLILSFLVTITLLVPMSAANAAKFCQERERQGGTITVVLKSVPVLATNVVRR